METRSEADLKSIGMYKYAADPSTDILCIAFKTDASDPFLWVPEKFEHLLDDRFNFGHLIVNSPPNMNDYMLIEAHNVGFEKSLWHEVMHKRYGFPDLDQAKLRCSAAKAASFSLPRALGQACRALGVSEQKDNTD